MRSMGGLLLFFLLALGALTWAVLWGPLRGELLFPPMPTRTRQTPAAAGETTQDPPASVARQQSSSPRKKKEVEPTAAEVVAPPASPPVASSPPPPNKFPTAVDVPLGTLGSAILTDFGPPSARTLSVDKGGQVEILIYRRALPDTMTVIQLRNGRVVSANSTAY